ncbi:hypothetical protein MRX96_054500 [Rhipicephalus microplus]
MRQRQLERVITQRILSQHILRSRSRCWRGGEEPARRCRGAQGEGAYSSEALELWIELKCRSGTHTGSALSLTPGTALWRRLFLVADPAAMARLEAAVRAPPRMPLSKEQIRSIRTSGVLFAVRM